MQESGAIPARGGDHNKTHLRDYDRAVSPQTGLLLKAHKSNYKIVGFAKDVAIGDLAAVGHQHGIRSWTIWDAARWSVWRGSELPTRGRSRKAWPPAPIWSCSAP